MGCANTCVGKEEQQNEQVDDIYGAKTIEKGTRRQPDGPESISLKKLESSDVPEREILKLVRAQSLIRGFLQRRAYRAKKMEHEGSSKYFTQEEAKETVGGEFAHVEGVQ